MSLVKLYLGDYAQKDDGAYAGWMLYARGANGSDNHFNPKALKGSKMVDAGTVLSSFSIINMTLSTSMPGNLLEMLSYLNTAQGFATDENRPTTPINVSASPSGGNNNDTSIWHRSSSGEIKSINVNKSDLDTKYEVDEDNVTITHDKK